MDVGCSLQWFGASSMLSHHHLVSDLPQSSYYPPAPQVVYQHKGALICPIIVCQGAKILSMYDMECGLQSTVVLSLNHVFTPSLSVRPLPFS